VTNSQQLNNVLSVNKLLAYPVRVLQESRQNCR